MFNKKIQVHSKCACTLGESTAEEMFCTLQTKELIKQRDIWKERAKDLAKISPEASPEQVQAWSEYKKYRNRINNRKKNEEKSYKAGKLAENAESPEIVWKNAKMFMGWKNSGTPHQIKVENKLVTSAKEIAEIMNTFFVGKVQNIRAGMKKTVFSVDKICEIMHLKTCKLRLKHTTEAKVKKILNSLSNSRSTGMDELDNFSVKLAADYLAKPLHHVVTLSVMQQKFPTLWKLSKVLPLHKKEDPLLAKNYRPVAILSPLSKVLEKLIYESIYNYFTANKLFHQNLHGYRKNRSTQTALIQMYDRWVKAASAGQVSGVVLLDLSAAFDLVDPSLLLQKLKAYGVEEDMLCWMQTYLTGRQQAVWIDHALSDFVECEVGVPQGSNLGPLLFLIFYNDLPHSLSCPLDAYADDSTITVSDKSTEEIGAKMTENCELVSDWMVMNKLKLNADKTHLMTVGTTERLRLLENKVSVVMDGFTLEESPEKVETLLGLQIEPGLKWQKQVEELIKKLRKRLTGLAHLRNIAHYQLRKTIAEGIFMSVLTYCLPVFGGGDKEHLLALQVMQNKAARIVTHSPLRTPRTELFSQLGWLTVNQLTYYHTALCTWRIRQSREPEYLASLLARDGITGKIQVSNTRLTLAKRSFCYRGSAEWNSLPENIRKASKISQFKVLVKKWILQNVPQFLDVNNQ